MAPPGRPAAILLPLSALGFLCGAITAALTDVLPYRFTFVRPDNLFLCFTQAQIFFALFVWPLFIPSIAARGEIRPLALHAGGVALLGFPLGLVCANVSDAGTMTLARGQLLAASVTALVASIYALGLRRGRRVGPWYVLGAFAVSAGLPWLAFLLYEFGPADRPGLPWMAALSPFWAGSRVDANVSLAPAAVWAAVSAILLVAARAPRGEAAP
jgi:hypothetical protein